MTRICILGPLAALIATGSPARADAPYFVALGDLPGGGFASWPDGISADGNVVVGQGTSSGASPNEAFRWTRATGMVGLGDLHGGHPPNSWGRATSGDGSVVVGWAGFQDHFEAFRWTSGGMVGLGHLPGGAGGDSGAVGVSRDGNVVVGYSDSAHGYPYGEAFVWSAQGGMRGLGDWPGGGYAAGATGVSADGSVVVGGSSTSEAFRWTAAQGFQPLGFLPGGTRSGAGGVSPDGRIVFGAADFPLGGGLFGLQPFRWTADGGMVGLGPMPGGFFGAHAFAMSDDGNTIVGAGTNAQGHQVPMIWDPQHGMRDLQALFVQDYGFDLSHWRVLYDAYGVSGDGLTITGYGINVDGNSEAWVAHIPEPGSLALLAAALVVFRMRRQ